MSKFRVTVSAQNRQQKNVYIQKDLALSEGIREYTSEFYYSTSAAATVHVFRHCDAALSYSLRVHNSFLYEVTQFFSANDPPLTASLNNVDLC